MSEVLPILQVKQVTACRLSEDETLQTVLHDVSLSIAPGEIVSVVGPSGCGKSTLLRLCNRLLEPISGRVLFNGSDLRSYSPPTLRKQVALLSQKPFLYQGTVRDNLSVPAQLTRKTVPDFSVRECQELLSLCQVHSEWLDRDSQRLSIGQQQRVCLARVLLGDCKVLLLDEPTSALDRPTAEALSLTFRKLTSSRDLAILLVTHDLRIAELCADRMLVMIEGRIVEQGTVRTVLDSPQSTLVKKFIGRSDTGSERDKDERYNH